MHLNVGAFCLWYMYVAFSGKGGRFVLCLHWLADQVGVTTISSRNGAVWLPGLWVSGVLPLDVHRPALTSHSVAQLVSLGCYRKTSAKVNG